MKTVMLLILAVAAAYPTWLLLLAMLEARRMQRQAKPVRGRWFNEAEQMQAAVDVQERKWN